jgi:hypothetical protein
MSSGVIMTATITKSQLVDQVRDRMASVRNERLATGAASRDCDEDDSLADLCNTLITDIELMFSYRSGDETWSHTADLAGNDPFPSRFPGGDTIISPKVSKFLYERADFYFSQDFLRTRDLDWFYMDFVVAVGFKVLDSNYRDKDFKAVYPKFYAFSKDYATGNLWAVLRYILQAVVKLAIWLVLLIVLVSTAADGKAWAGFLAGGLIAWVVSSRYLLTRRLSKLKAQSTEKLSHYIAFYGTLADGFIRWNLIEHRMKRLSDLCVDFPLAVDTAISNRRRID